MIPYLKDPKDDHVLEVAVASKTILTPIIPIILKEKDRKDIQNLANNFVVYEKK